MLPIVEYRQDIIDSVQSHPVTIVVAETGAGKSTKVPQFLLDSGLRVLVTEPRRLAASSLAERVAEERRSRLGGEVGFRTGRDRQDSADTRLLFVTDGLALVRELMGAERKYDVLVIDECHEWNINLEILVAWARREILDNKTNFRLVIMSATLEAEALSAFFDGAPIINVPGRCYPVATRQPTRFQYDGAYPLSGIVADVKSLVEEGRNVLVFAPGKSEIEATTQALSGCHATVVSLHGEMTRAEQREAFAVGQRKVVVATNVAQTSITIPDIDAVVDSGLARQVEVHRGVEGLYLRPISVSDSRQRAGRAGRTKPGIYIDHHSGERPEWPVAEIQRTLLEQTLLRLLVAGIDLSDFQLFHQPKSSDIAAAKTVLRALGLLENGKPTERGTRVSKLPVGVRAGCMLLEAEQRRCVKDIATIAAITEVGGILDTRPTAQDPQTHRYRWMNLAIDPQSDHITQWRAFIAAENTKNWDRLGLHPRAMQETKEVRRQILEACRDLDMREGLSDPSRSDLLQCVLSGHADQIVLPTINRWGDRCWDGRKPSKDSVVPLNQRTLAVGTPFDVSTKRGGVLSLIQMVSVIELDWIRNAVPWMISESVHNPRLNGNQCVVDSVVLYADREIARSVVQLKGPAASDVLADLVAKAIVTGYTDFFADNTLLRNALVYSAEQWRRAREVGLRQGSPLEDSVVRTAVRTLVGAAEQLDDLDPDKFRVELVSDSEWASIMSSYPDNLQIGGVEMPVRYRNVAAYPIVHGWDQAAVLPDAPVTPGGRPLKVMFVESWYGERPVDDIADLRVQAQERLASMAFDRWYDRPTLTPSESISMTKFGPNPEQTAWGYADGSGTKWFRQESEARDSLAKSLAAAKGEKAYRALKDAWDRLHMCSLRDEVQTALCGVCATQYYTVDVVRFTTLTSLVLAEVECVEKDVQAFLAQVEIVDRPLAAQVVRFVAKATKVVGSMRLAEILERENEQAYGRSRREDSLLGQGITDLGGLDWAYGRDVVLAAKWARICAGAPAIQRVQKVVRTPAKPQSSGSFRSTFGDLLAQKLQRGASK